MRRLTVQRMPLSSRTQRHSSVSPPPEPAAGPLRRAELKRTAPRPARGLQRSISSRKRKITERKPIARDRLGLELSRKRNHPSCRKA